MAHKALDLGAVWKWNRYNSLAQKFKAGQVYWYYRSRSYRKIASGGTTIKIVQCVKDTIDRNDDSAFKLIDTRKGIDVNPPSVWELAAIGFSLAGAITKEREGEPTELENSK